MVTHVKIIAWLTIVLHGMTLLLGGCIWAFFMFLGGAAAISDPSHSAGVGGLAVLGSIGTLALGFFAVISVPGMIIGWGLLNRAEWARIGAVILGILNLLYFPFGTALAVYTFVIMFDKETVAMFQR